MVPQPYSTLLPLLLASQQGVEPEGLGTTRVRETLQLLDVPELWIVVLLLLPALALVSFLGYGREALSLRAKLSLGTLRFLALLVLLLVLFRPVFVQRNETSEPAEVLVLFDDSASMSRMDAYAGEGPELAALQRLAGGSLARKSRLDLARAGFERELAPLLARGGYEVRTLRFDADVAPLAELSDLSARGHSTHMGDALSRALAGVRGRHVTDVVIFSDGRNTGGLSPFDTARSAGAAGLPVHTVLVGDTRPERNVLVELVEVPTNALEGDEVALSVRVVGRGTRPDERVRVVLEELPAGRDEQPRPLAEESLVPGPEGRHVVLVAPPASLEGGRRERRFRVSVPPLEGETLLDDNELRFSVQVTPERIRVLYVDGYPRWEYRYLKHLLLRADENLVVQCYLLSATPDFAQESTRGVPSLERVPTARRELLENYDVIILGDVNPYAVSPDPARCEEFLQSLRAFVEGGGGLLLQAGEYENPRSFVDTPLQDLLPVVLDPTGALAFGGDTTRELRPRLEEPGQPHQIVRLDPDTETNRRLWEEAEGLRGFFWYFPITRAKPGSQVLLRHPEAEGAYGRHPLLVVGYFPQGRTMFLGLDSTWMWRYRYGDRYHERFWRNAIRWLALGRLKSANRRMRLDSLKTVYSIDERIAVEARVLDEDFRPSEEPRRPLRVQGPEGSETDRTLELVPGRPGLYRAGFEVDRPGLYRVWMEERGQLAASTEFEVELPSRENADPTPDPRLMASVATLSGGRAVPLARLATLAPEFPGGEERRQPISSKLDDAWDHWGTLLLALGLLSAEWILRKRLELV